MRAMALTRAGAGQLEAVDLELPEPSPSEVLVRVLACGVCRTDLHVVDGELPDPAIPVAPGHEIVGRIERVGEQVKTFARATASAFPGWDGHAANANSAMRGVRTCVVTPAIPAIRSTVGTQNSCWRMRAVHQNRDVYAFVSWR